MVKDWSGLKDALIYNFMSSCLMVEVLWAMVNNISISN
jgi:hypothetical protein